MTVPRPLTRVLWRVVVVITAVLCALVSALPDPSRPVVVAAVVSLIAAVAAACSGWRPAGDATVALVTVAVLLAAALDRSDLRPVQVVLAGPLVLLLVTALDRGTTTAGRGEVIVMRAPATSRLALATAATGAAVLVSVTAAQQVVPSVWLVLVGLAAAVAAMVVATRAHRN